MDPGKDPSQMVSTVSEVNTIRPMTQNTRASYELAHLASEQGISEDPTQTPNPHYGSGDPLLPKTYSDYAEPKMLDTINEHMDEVHSIHNMGRQAAQLLAKTNESNSALEARTRTLRTQLIVIREKYPTIAKGKSSFRPRDPQKDHNNEDGSLDPQPEQPSNWLNIDEESTSDQHNVDPELIQSTDGPNNRSNPKQALGRARTKLLAKTAGLERLYADQVPADHLKQVAAAA
ncbi:hypothetical protein M422DRAFT_270628 [Sphaerobolus stellatus SS14]|uniref:Uncharacterized protein n=1 Tax=Sphaerobolus stellatus (strain SS14) TaxID=990650 RepID=A0A0C9URZ0_SPHS4|nr:hypothetical protein M422DRAFT_270628 [Sphaerobolus stellatus SS14]